MANTNSSSSKGTRTSRKAAQQEAAPVVQEQAQQQQEAAPVATHATHDVAPVQEQAPVQAEVAPVATTPTTETAPVVQEQAQALPSWAQALLASAAMPSTPATTAKVRRNATGTLQQRTDNALAHAADTALPRRTPQGASNMHVPQGSNMHRVLCALAAAPGGLCPAGITQATGLVKGRQLVPLQAAGYITRIHAGKGGYLCAITPAGLAAIGQAPAEPAPATAADAAQGQPATSAA